MFPAFPEHFTLAPRLLFKGASGRRKAVGPAAQAFSRGNRLACSLDPHLDIAPLQFELGDIFLN